MKKVLKLDETETNMVAKGVEENLVSSLIRSIENWINEAYQKGLEEESE